MLSYLAQSPSPAPVAAHRNAGGFVVLIVLVVLAVLATVWIRRAATRYRRRLHGS